MSKKEKLLKRIKQKPKDFTYTELETLLVNLNFKEVSKGKTSGSRVEFLHEEKKIAVCIHQGVLGKKMLTLPCLLTDH